jgi:hypothetical protein
MVESTFSMFMAYGDVIFHKTLLEYVYRQV